MDKFLKQNMEKKKPELRFIQSDFISLKLEKRDNRIYHVRNEDSDYF